MTENILILVLFVSGCIASYVLGRSGTSLQWVRGVEDVLDKLAASDKSNDFNLGALWALKTLSDIVEGKR